MFTKSITAVLAATLMSSVAFAQTPAPAQSTAPAQTMSHKGEWRASKLIGVNVYNEKDEKLGDINEILMDQSGKVVGYVIGVGGFIGMGEHDVLMSPDKVKFVKESRARTADNRPATTGSAANDRRVADKWYPDHAVMSATKDQLKAMPQFKYSNYN